MGSSGIKKSYSHSEMYHSLLKLFMLEIFTDHDFDKDGVIKMSEFPAMMNQLCATPRKHGLTCCPSEDSFETLFKKYDPRGDGMMTVDEFIKLATEEVFKKCIQ